jgi:hypothetical protein
MLISMKLGLLSRSGIGNSRSTSKIYTEDILIKRIIGFYAVTLFFIVSIGAAPACATSDDASTGRMTKQERAFLVSQLTSSRNAMLAKIHKLSQAQWTFKPAPDKWSIAECAEHLILAEDLIFNEAQKTLHTPVATRLDIATPEGDRQVLAQIEDRSKKAKAPAVLQPSEKFATPESATKEFMRRRNNTIDYVKHTHDPVRAHVGDGPSQNTRDVYQFLLELAGHTVRHTTQIEEIKSASGFPGS